MHAPSARAAADSGCRHGRLTWVIGLLFLASLASGQEKAASGIQVKVFPVERGDAVARAQMLQTMLGQGQILTQPLRLAADRRTSTIIAVGSLADLEVIRGLLARLDETATNQRHVPQPRPTAPAPRR